MVAANARARLDRGLRTRGEDMVLRRRVGTGSTFVEITVRGTLRGYSARDVGGGIVQGDSLVILSPTALLNSAPAAWPGAAGGVVLPRVNDGITQQGRVRNVISVAPFMEAGEVVRLELQVRG